MPPKPQYLTSTTTSNGRRSYHWRFSDGGEIDLSLEKQTIYIQIADDCYRFADRIAFQKWLADNSHTDKIMNWFAEDDLPAFIESEQQWISLIPNNNGHQH
jgi:hypothetical protein